MVAAGQSVEFAAIGPDGAAVPAIWRVSEGNGSFAGSRFTAPSRLADASRIHVAAQVGGLVEETEVAVTGLVPGLVQRVHEYVDLRVAAPVGWFAEHVAVSGNRAYVTGTGRVAMWGSRDYFWIDVFDVTDPLQPIWLGAVESLTHPDALFVLGDRLVAGARSDWATGWTPTLAVFDIGGALPRALGHAAWGTATVWRVSTRDSRWVYTWEPGSSDGDHLSILQSDLASGAAVARYDLPLPHPAQVAGIFATGERLLVGLGSSIAVYDTTVSPPALLGEAAGPASSASALDPYLYADPNMYDIGGALPALIGVQAEILAAGDGRAIYPSQWNTLILDLSQPAAPLWVGSMFAGGSYAWAGPWLLSADGAGGLAVYGVAPPGGPQPRASLDGGVCLGLLGSDSAVDGESLVVVGKTKCDVVTYGELAIDDLGSSPPAYRGLAVDLHNPALSVQVIGSGGLAFVGQEHGLALYDLSIPSSPTVLSTTPLDGAVLALRGDVLFAATSQGRLAVLDVTSPSAPVEIGTASLQGTPLRARLAGDLLLLSLGASGLAVYDVSVPEAPWLLAQVPLAGPAADALVVADVALVAAGEAGLAIVDLRDPARPVELAVVKLEPEHTRFWNEAPFPTKASALTLRGDLLFVGSHSGYGILHAFDVRDPRRPALATLSFADVASAFAWNGSDTVHHGGRRGPGGHDASPERLRHRASQSGARTVAANAR